MGSKTLAEEIEKKIQYDSDGGNRCPHCKKFVREPHHWLYHKWTLANNIARYKGYPEIFVSKIEELYLEKNV